MISEMRKLRILKNLTLDDLFLRTDINIPKLSRIERGIFKPSKKEKKLISKALGIKPKEIFREN